MMGRFRGTAYAVLAISFFAGSPGESSEGGVATAAAATPSPSPTPSSSLRRSGSGEFATPDVRDIPTYAKKERLDRIDNRKYNHLLAWLECLTLSAGQSVDIEAKCRFRNFVLLERDRATGRETILMRDGFKLDAGHSIQCGPAARRTRQANCRGASYKRFENGRLVWYDDQDEPDGRLPLSDGVSNVDGRTATFNVALIPTRVAHSWTLTNRPPWRAAWSAGKDYYVQAEISVSGAAAARLGADGWRDDAHQQSCPKNRTYGCKNLQMFQGPWLGDSQGEFYSVRYKIN